VPINEPGDSKIISGNEKWLHGLRWEEIDENLILRHMPSHGQNLIEIDLRLIPMVMEELRLVERKPSGPVVVSERYDLPWQSYEFRRKWRTIAVAAGVPENVRNMNSRARAANANNGAGHQGLVPEQIRATESKSGARH